MSWFSIVADVGVYFTLCAGFIGLVNPARVAEFVHLQAADALGWIEIRCMFGGLFIGIACVCIFTGHPYAYLCCASVWLGGAAGKVVGFFLDNPPKPMASVSTLFDVSVGLCLLLGFVNGGMN